jgi:dipeptidyl aminopeptidase/acylaminoacyl peptidase
MPYIWRFAHIWSLLLFAYGAVPICGAQTTSPPPLPDYRPTVEIQHEDLAAARRHFKTNILRQGPPPTEWVDLDTPKGATEVVYPSGNLRLKAWMNITADKKKHDGVLFLHPGFGLWPDAWEFTQPLREAGYVVMIPTLRGENGQHGIFTMYYDEVSDVVNAADFLRSQEGVDPDHLYVAGYSVGGTLSMLASEVYDHFRAAASISGTPDLGPYLRYARGAKENAPFDVADPREVQIRSALAYAASLKSSIRIYYGTKEEYFAIAAPRTAEIARQNGIDAEAVAVDGDHGSSSEQSLRLAIEFFKKQR